MLAPVENFSFRQSKAKIFRENEVLGGANAQEMTRKHDKPFNGRKRKVAAFWGDAAGFWDRDDLCLEELTTCRPHSENTWLVLMDEFEEI